MNIKISTSRIMQAVLIILHILNIVLPVVPADAKVYVTTGIGILNVLVNEWAHNSNPDGTAAKPAVGGTQVADPKPAPKE